MSQSDYIELLKNRTLLKDTNRVSSGSTRNYIELKSHTLAQKNEALIQSDYTILYPHKRYIWGIPSDISACPTLCSNQID